MAAKDKSTWTRIAGAEFRFGEDRFSGELTVWFPNIDGADISLGTIEYGNGLLPPTSYNLSYSGKVDANGSTGYLTVNGVCAGESVFMPPNFPWETDFFQSSIKITISPGFETATLNIKGLLNDEPCQLIRTILAPGN